MGGGDATDNHIHDKNAMDVFLLSIEHLDERIRLFGITSDNRTVNLLLSNFTHHCYLRQADYMAMTAGGTAFPAPEPATMQVRDRTNAYGFNASEPFVYLADPSLSVIRAWADAAKARKYTVFNSSLSPVQQFMMQSGFHGGAWVRVAAARRVFADEEIYEVAGADMALDAANTAYPPSMRIVSFDIETVKNRTCQIATAFYTLDANLGKTSVRVVAQTLRQANPLRGAEVRFYGRDRRRMYAEWAAMVRDFEPHILTGYNIKNFDMPVVLADAAACGLSGEDFSFARKTLHANGTRSARPAMSAKQREHGGSKQAGARKQTDVSVPGVIVLDVYEAVLANDRKHKSNKLGNVSKALLGYTKLDVEYKEIPRILADTSDGWIDRMTRMLDYNRVDATLPFDIAERQKNWSDMIAMSRVAGGQLEWVYGRGQTCKAVALIAREMFLQGYIMPDMRRPKSERVVETKEAKEERYEGAVVLDPVEGIYDYIRNPDGSYKLNEAGERTPAFVTTVDFASLYPSIIRAFNFCFTTLILSGVAPPGTAARMSEFGALFVEKETRRGVLPKILDVLTDNRAAVRARQKPLVAAAAKALGGTKRGTPEYDAAMAALKAAQATPEYEALECMQLAIKRVSNSIYGATGSPNFFLPCVQIAASVTAEGRKNIKEKTKPYIEAKYPGCTIVYGDTDSIFVMLGLPTMEATMAAGKELAAEITRHINCPPIKLEWEKVLWPAVFTSKKKNYYGRYWTNAEYYDKLYVRGLAFIKSSTCAFMSAACERVCEMIVCEMRPMEEVLAYVRSKCAELWTIARDRSNAALLESLLLYMKNGKDHYENINGMTELVRKNNARGNAPIELGERVPYYVVRVPEDEMAFRVEHEEYVLRHPEIEIDVQYYVDKQWRNTLHNLMPGYEKQADEALMPPAQHSMLAYAVEGSAPSRSAFAAFEAQLAVKRQREEEAAAAKASKKRKVSEPKLKSEPRAAKRVQAESLPESTPVAPKRPRLITDFFGMPQKKEQ